MSNANTNPPAPQAPPVPKWTGLPAAYSPEELTQWVKQYELRYPKPVNPRDKIAVSFYTLAFIRRPVHHSEWWIVIREFGLWIDATKSHKAWIWDDTRTNPNTTLFAFYHNSMYGLKAWGAIPADLVERFRPRRNTGIAAGAANVAQQQVMLKNLADELREAHELLEKMAKDNAVK